MLPTEPGRLVIPAGACTLCVADAWGTATCMPYAAEVTTRHGNGLDAASDTAGVEEICRQVLSTHSQYRQATATGACGRQSVASRSGSPLVLFGLPCLTPPPPGPRRRGRLLARCRVITSWVSRGTHAYKKPAPQNMHTLVARLYMCTKLQAKRMHWIMCGAGEPAPPRDTNSTWWIINTSTARLMTIMAGLAAAS